VPPERFDADMKAGVTELAARVHGKRMAAIGFCFGGGMVWRLLAAGGRRLSAAAPFYDPVPEGGDLRRAKAAVLGGLRRPRRPRRRDAPGGPGRDPPRRASRAGSSSSARPTTRSSTTPARASTRPRQPRHSADAALVRALRGRREDAPRIGMAPGSYRRGGAATRRSASAADRTPPRSLARRSAAHHRLPLAPW
jgi:hypothetical protein